MENLTKSQRKKLKKERKMLEKEQRFQARLKRDKVKKIKLYGVIALCILAVAAYVFWYSRPVANAPIIQISPEGYDFGAVSVAKGKVSTLLSVRNVGEADLIIDGLETSCMCTTASIIHDGVEGPKFGMAGHGTNPTNWEEVIAPGESAQLKIYYDPNVHEDMRGSVTRQVYINSNDPRKGRSLAKIYANQVD